MSETNLVNKAKAVCKKCPVKKDCLEYALSEKIEYGVWGGMTAAQRRTERRRRTKMAGGA